MSNIARIVALSLVLLGAGAVWLAVRDSQAAAPPQQEGKTSDDGLWRDVAESSVFVTGERAIIPRAYRTLRLNRDALAGRLARAPMEFTRAAERRRVTITIPMPDGTFARFRVVESPIMEPELAAKFPEIKTYSGQGIDDPAATMRFDVTPAGFRAIVFSAEGTVYIDPYAQGDADHYITYYKRDYRRDGEPIRCLVPEASPDAALVAPPPSRIEPQIVSNGGTLRTYRLAMAATGEYTAFFRQAGDTDAQARARAMAAMTTTMNRVNGIFGREVGVRMVFVANQDTIIYTNASTDPYTAAPGTGTINTENQTNLDNVIGNANYDIGHVVGISSGGLALTPAVCVTGGKAQGSTGRPTPSGDAFDVDFVAHEMGHQFSARHTFNDGTTGSCGGTNRVAGSAYEPGSGSTVMAYAGICGAADLQSNSDDHFHVKSLEDIVAYITSGGGSGCDTETNTGNSAPNVNAGANFTIPSRTPFVLTASGSDPDGDALTYCWEQYDLGAASPPEGDNGDRPLFRSFKPTASPARTFPRLSDILGNTSTFGEALPTTTRTMNFQVTARDNRSGGGARSAAMQVNVRGDAGPFVVTQPNTNLTWRPGSSQTVTWNVANTQNAPISCANVRVLLSTDGGNTFPTVLAASTSNDGSQAITLPDVTTGQARVKVEAVGNIFFDISNVNFIINAPPEITCPANLTRNNDAGQCGAIVTFAATATDADPVTVACTPPSGSFFPKGATTVNCTATDSFGETDTCSFTVTVNDTEPPAINCPAAITVGNDPGLCSAAVDPGLATATDNCPGVTVAGVRSDGLALTAPYPVGTTTITWTATDAVRLQTTCTQAIVVNDIEPPVISNISVNPAVLWPPNHKVVSVAVNYTVTDNCTAAEQIVCALSVASNEPINGLGDGDTAPTGGW